MSWQCALLQRWLPEYPDGDLSGWRKRWLQSHLAHCTACRHELGEIREVVTAITGAPVPDPGPEFWTGFSRDMHLKLVQAAQEDQAQAAPPPPRRWRWPYLLGAPALAVLLLWVAGQFSGPGTPGQHQARVKPPAASRVAKVAKTAPAPPSRVAAIPPGGMEQFTTVALDASSAAPMEEEDITGWDLDAELAGMTEQEKESFLHKLDQREKDGSCIVEYSFCSWG
jgi:anti-sigma factor RsiW